MSEEAPQEVPEAPSADAAPAAAPPAGGVLVVVEPASVQVPAAGGNAVLQLQNQNAGGRYSFKIKSTNNEHYRVNPVFGFVEPGAAVSVELTRLSGPPKSDDRLEIIFMNAPADATDPKALYTSGASPEFKQDVPMVSQ